MIYMYNIIIMSICATESSKVEGVLMILYNVLKHVKIIIFVMYGSLWM